MPLASSTHHQRAAGLLTGYIQGILEPAEDTFVTAHLGLCPCCEQDLLKLADTFRALYDAGPSGFPDG